MVTKRFEVSGETVLFAEEIGRFMPGGFFVYKAEKPEELIYANEATFEIFGCKDLEEFRELTGYTFKGLVYPEDYERISSSINDQIDKSDDNLDYVEYRIVRKDGMIRWVDDFGHYVETDTYGGVYFVFISDITEKRSKRETDLATRQAVIEALSESYHTMWLISDVETEQFSLYRGDIKGETPHSAPIQNALTQVRYSDAKDYYIRTTVAPGDQERLNEELKMENIIEKLQKKPQYTINYLREMDDGTERFFRIEFVKVDMPDGKMGIVCGFKDVDDEVREAEAEARLKQQEYEEKLALHDRLIEQEKSREQQNKLITALASDYWSVYYLELDKNEGVCYQSHPDVDNGFKVGDHFPYLESVTAYANTYVTDQYREEFLRFIQPDSIRERLQNERVISYRYTVFRHGRESYEMVKFAGVRHPEDRPDHLMNSVGACFTNVDIETRKSLAQSEALSNALAAAEQASTAKTTFLSNMSHEIRTPMNAIIGLNNIAMNDPETSEKTKDYLRKIDTSAKHLLSIINDILDMSRIESGRMVIKNEEFSFSKTLEQVNTMISGQCRDKGLHYECHIKGKIDDYYIGDDMKLRQVLVNILGNAVKFTPSGGSVSMNIEDVAHFDKKATLRFTIKDTGIGMSKEYLPQLFDAFTQEDTKVANSMGSTGLGMPITKSIVELMNGHIEVDSEKGVGTTFTVTVTLDESKRHASEEVDRGFDPHEMDVLVIDDDEVACQHAKIVLGQVGVICDTASSGEEALDKVRMRHTRREDYHLILVDWKMPEMDGLETTKAIREIVGHETPIIILTSYNWDDIIEEATKAGVDSFVPKPLFAGNVLDEFKEAFKRKNEILLASKADLAGRHILLAEDVEINAEIMGMILSAREIDVDLAENGKEALDKFSASEEGHYDAILMDMRMPVMDGLEATRAIRALDRKDAKLIPIIALTANAFDEDVQRSMQAGLNAHLSKPVEPDALFETLESLIR